MPRSGLVAEVVPALPPGLALAFDAEYAHLGPPLAASGADNAPESPVCRYLRHHRTEPPTPFRRGPWNFRLMVLSRRSMPTKSPSWASDKRHTGNSASGKVWKVRIDRNRLTSQSRWTSFHRVATFPSPRRQVGVHAHGEGDFLTTQRYRWPAGGENDDRPEGTRPARLARFRVRSVDATRRRLASSRITNTARRSSALGQPRTCVTNPPWNALAGGIGKTELGTASARAPTYLPITCFRHSQCS